MRFVSGNWAHISPPAAVVPVTVRFPTVAATPVRRPAFAMEMTIPLEMSANPSGASGKPSPLRSTGMSFVETGLPRVIGVSSVKSKSLSRST